MEQMAIGQRTRTFRPMTYGMPLSRFGPAKRAIGARRNGRPYPTLASGMCP
jgi:hypothetical protein